MNMDDRLAMGERVRAACIEAALDGYEDAAMAGLCGEGALEVAISAMRRVALEDLMDDKPSDKESQNRPQR